MKSRSNICLIMVALPSWFGACVGSSQPAPGGTCDSADVLEVESCTCPGDTRTEISGNNQDQGDVLDTENTDLRVLVDVPGEEGLLSVQCPQDPPVPENLLRLHATVDGLFDESGRRVVLRGLNFGGMDNGKTGLYQEEDFQSMAKYGYNAIRLVLGWKGFEKEKGEWSEAYMGDVVRIVDLAEKYGIYVIIDLHQWFWSASGMPDWTCSLEKHWTADFLTGCAEQFFGSQELRDAFGHVWRKIAKRFAGRAAVAGYDIMNEPPPTSFDDLLSGEFEGEVLPQFYEQIASVIRAQDPDAVIMVEPGILNLGTSGLGAMDVENAIYSPHIYVPHNYYEGQGLVWLLEPDPGLLALQYQGAFEKAKELGMALAIGEFGAPADDPKFAAWLRASGEWQDRLQASSFVWEYHSGGVWGVFQGTKMKPSYVQHLLRPYVARAAGELREAHAEPWTGYFEAKMYTPPEKRCLSWEIVLRPPLYTSEPTI